MIHLYISMVLSIVEIARHRMTRSQLEDALKKADESQ